MEFFYLTSSRKKLSYFHLIFNSCWIQTVPACCALWEGKGEVVWPSEPHKPGQVLPMALCGAACPGSSGHREGWHQWTWQHSCRSCWAVQYLPLLSHCSSPLQVPALESEAPPEQWGVPPLACMAFNRGWLLVWKNGKIIKFYGPCPAPNMNFLVKPQRAWDKIFLSKV